ncbi:MAG: GMC family oxidoreductase N-terminal domain-containing protein [Pseudomonadota bacterium]|nr:GMC family oxidoreductase N-terminal domain-containing protein [Pseudomonadota bacterium]
MKKKSDYIVIGAGAAGCLLANRLSANKKHKVLLLEAGGKDWNPLIKIPLYAGFLYYLPSLNWKLNTIPQVGLASRSITWPRGKVLGGSTAINGMMYMRGQKEDYDSWERLGLKGWSYSELLPYFKSFEKNFSHSINDNFHGNQGELFTEKAKPINVLYEKWIESAKLSGFITNDDFNGKDQEGIGPYDFNIKNGKRVSAAKAFLEPIKSRENLEIITNAHVQKLIIDENSCKGVEVKLRSGDVSFYANHEVILSSGSINSPKILQLSGIGESTKLNNLGIKVKKDLPEVGKNLQDHIGIYLKHSCSKPVTLFGEMRPDKAIISFFRALLFGNGPASKVPLEVGGFLKTASELERPDVHVTFVPGLSLSISQKGQLQHGFLTNVYQLRPESKGSISIKSSNPDDMPLIDPNYFSSEIDKQCIREAFKLIRKISLQSPLDEYRKLELSPGKEVENDDEIDDWISQTADTIFHPVGTCRMGCDDNAVVNNELKLNGIQKLRVIDASIMPKITSGNTSIPSMMIAEKGAKMILE